jgi:transketolase C-terminal domain/subunit
MTTAAAGMALMGKIPFVTTFAVFASMRACEQVRTDIAYPNLKVRIVGTHSGLSSGSGTTHNCHEDLAIMRSMANMTVIAPGDPNQIGKSEWLCSYDTLQFDDYSKVYAPRFDPEKKAQRRAEVFPTDCKKAFDMGTRFAQGLRQG